MQVAAILLAVLAVSSAQYAYPGFGGGYQGIYPGQQVGGYYPSNYGGFYPGGQQAFGGFANAYPYGGYNAKSVVVPQVAGSAAVAKTIPAQVKYVAAPQATPYAAYPYGAVASQYPAYPTAGQIGGVAAPGVAGNGVYFSSPSYQYSY